MATQRAFKVVNKNVRGKNKVVVKNLKIQERKYVVKRTDKEKDKLNMVYNRFKRKETIFVAFHVRKQGSKSNVLRKDFPYITFKLKKPVKDTQVFKLIDVVSGRVLQDVELEGAHYYKDRNVMFIVKYKGLRLECNTEAYVIYKERKHARADTNKPK